MREILLGDVIFKMLLPVIIGAYLGIAPFIEDSKLSKLLLWISNRGGS